ncbi:DUF397 domain-containing protein [Streptomyces sp. DASNCL29]|uniref:DUF397 domain-containing protein n=1 Tax=Streptomyces sp. DASNCL29 TaxID=2583819 RepID=UPI00110FE10B|nr:DUF397 domain-containing protein [Streptomyces sp. DASNCL29]TMU94745.1 DUF397 domain-containing protein [Streptomyces sp. DASNCL29]
MSHIQWRKSSYSGDVDGNACVELAHGQDTAILLRESDEPHTVITTTPAALRALTRAARAGRFDQLSR